MTQLLRILASLSIIAVTVVTVDLLFGKMADSQFMEKPGIQTQYELTSLRDIDILIVGSSRARRHYDTPYISEQLSCRAYNVGYDAIGITFYLAMIKSILDKTEPRLLIVDALAHEFSGELNDRINNLNPYIALNHKIMDVAIEIDPIKDTPCVAAWCATIHLCWTCGTCSGGSRMTLQVLVSAWMTASGRKTSQKSKLLLPRM